MTNQNELKEIETKINELAEVVIPTEGLKSFKEMDLKDKVFGIKFFATVSKDENIIEICEHAEKVLN